MECRLREEGLAFAFFSVSKTYNKEKRTHRAIAQVLIKIMARINRGRYSLLPLPLIIDQRSTPTPPNHSRNRDTDIVRMAHTHGTYKVLIGAHLNPELFTRGDFDIRSDGQHSSRRYLSRNICLLSIQHIILRFQQSLAYGGMEKTGASMPNMATNHIWIATVS